MIRELQYQDKNDFLRILSQMTNIGKYTDQHWKEIFESISKDENITVFVKIVNNKIVGTASAVLVKKFIHGGGIAGQVEDVVVDEEYRNRGIATSLVKHITTYLRQKKCYKITLVCDVGIKNIYQSMGFQVSDIHMRLIK